MIRARDYFAARIEEVRAQLETKPPQSEGDARLHHLARFQRAYERCERVILNGYPER